MERGGVSGGFHGYLKVQCQTGAASVTVAAADMTLTSAEMNHNNNHHNHHYPSLHSDQLNHSHENHTTTTNNNHHPSNMSTQLPAAPPPGPDHAVDTECTVREQDRFMPIANVIRIMRKILPPHAKISDDAKETIQECVSEYISFITGEANERCQREQRKTITAEDVLWAMSKLGFDDYIEPLTLYLHRYRELEAGDRGAIRSSAEPLMKRAFEFGTGGAPVPTQPSSLAAAVTFAPPPPLFHIGHHHHHHPYFGHPPPLPPAIATMNGFIKDGNGATVSSHGHAGAETRTNGNSNSRQASGRVVGQQF